MISAVRQYQAYSYCKKNSGNIILGKGKLIFCLASPSQKVNAKCGIIFLFFILCKNENINAEKTKSFFTEVT